MSESLFNIPELLEAVLLQLPPRRVLIDQRVNKFWRETITGSLPIQEKLWYVLVRSS